MHSSKHFSDIKSAVPGRQPVHDHDADCEARLRAHDPANHDPHHGYQAHQDGQDHQRLLQLKNCAGGKLDSKKLQFFFIRFLMRYLLNLGQ